MVRKRICYSDFNPCPCKVVDLDIEQTFCNFISMFGESLMSDNNYKTKETEKLLEKVCPEVREEVLHHDYRARKLREREKAFLEKVKPGDVVFCTAEIHDVVFLEYPSHKWGSCKYKTIKGEIREAPTFCFNIVSKGDKSAEYKTSDEYKADVYEMTAREYGFRVERKMIKEEYILKIFGDEQEDVDQFVFNLNSGQIFDDFYDF
jgi:hypothetical protein